MKKLLCLFLSLCMALPGFSADAANDLILTQRKPDNSGNIQRNVAPTAVGVVGFDASKLPVNFDATTFGLGSLNLADAAAFRSYIGAGTGGGNVTGPGSSTANGIATWSGTGGISLLNTGVTITSNNIVTTGNVTGNILTGTSGNITGNLTVGGTADFLNFTTGNLTVTGNITGNLSATQVTLADAGGYYTGTNVEAALQEVGGSITALQSTVGPTPTGNQLISWGGVALAPAGGLDITVSPANYIIQGTSYASVQTNLTLTTADPTNPRIDVIAVNSSGNAVVITGTPAATPSEPEVDPSTQLKLTFFLVPAGATDLDVDVVEVYKNNAEWTTTQSGGTINVASTNNPYTGSVCIEGTTVTTGNYFQFVKPAAGTFDLADSDNLVFYIRSKASWANNRLISITVRTASAQVGSTVTFDQGLFGFDSSQTSTYQQIIIPTALFAANGQPLTTIRATVGGSGGTLGFYVDDVTLQGGVASITDASRMKWRGNWNAVLFYNPNDVVLGPNGVQYVAIQAGVGHTPASSPTFWQASSTGGTVTLSGSPVSGQAAEFTSASAITGVGVVGSGNYIKSPGGVTITTGKVFFATNNLTVTGTDGTSFAYPSASGTVVTKATNQKTFYLTIDDLDNSLNYGLGFVEAAFTIAEIRAVHTGSGLSSPSVLLTVFQGTDRSSGTAVVTAGSTITSSTTGTSVTSFDDATCPANSWLWITTGSKSGTTDNFEIMVRGTYD